MINFRRLILSQVSINLIPLLLSLLFPIPILLIGIFNNRFLIEKDHLFYFVIDTSMLINIIFSAYNISILRDKNIGEMFFAYHHTLKRYFVENGIFRTILSLVLGMLAILIAHPSNIYQTILQLVMFSLLGLFLCATELLLENKPSNYSTQAILNIVPKGFLFYLLLTNPIYMWLKNSTIEYAIILAIVVFSVLIFTIIPSPTSADQMIEADLKVFDKPMFKPYVKRWYL